MGEEKKEKKEEDRREEKNIKDKNLQKGNREKERNSNEKNHPPKKNFFRKGRRGGNSKVDFRVISELEVKQGDLWRIFKIISEFVMGFDELSKVAPGVTIFGSSRISRDNPYWQKAYELGFLLGKEGYTVITGGGPGVMEAANKGAFDSGAISVGLMIDIPDEEPAKEYHTISLNFDYFFVRKVMLVRYSIAYVIFPGGFGTFDELFELLNLIHTKKLYSFPIILFDQSFWNPFIDFIKNNLEKNGFILPHALEPIHIVNSPDEALNIIDNFLLEKHKLISDKLHPLERSRIYKLVKNIKQKMT